MIGKQRGFTLAEVLIALALLGAVAAFTIPKILQANRNNQTKSKVLEAVSVIEQTWYTAKLNGTYYKGVNTHLYDSIYSQFNALKSDPIGMPTDACGSLNTPPLGQENGYIILPNGVTISGLYGEYNQPCPSIPADLNTSVQNCAICISVDGTYFVGDFNPSGDFTQTMQGNANAKNFFWGSSTVSMYDNAGNPLGNGSGTVYQLLQ